MATCEVCGVEVDGRFFCCAHCARKGDEKGAEIRDAVGAQAG